MRIPPSLATLSAALAVALGCSSTPKSGSEPPKDKRKEMSLEKVLQSSDVKGKPPEVFNHSLDKTREAAVRSLVFVGCEIKKQETYYVLGERPRKWGLLVGSGGERVEAYLVPKSDTQTEVWIDTDTTFAGMAGQQGWSSQVMGELKRILSQ